MERTMPDDVNKTEELVELEPEEAVEVDLAPKKGAEESLVAVEAAESTEEIGDEPTEEELASYSSGVRKRIDKLTAKYRESERREQAALDYARGMKATNDSLQQSADRINQKYGEEYAGRVNTDLESAKKRYVQAYESGNPDELVAATTELSRLSVEDAALKNEMPVLGAPQPVLQQQQTPATAPPPDPKSQAWAQRNSWFGADEPMTYTAFAIHKNLVQQGFDTTTDAYYTEIDRRIREEFPHKFGETQVQPTNGSRAPVQRVASANRAAKSTGRDTVKLTPSQVAIAKKLGVPLEEYARQVKEISAHV
tara:strand:+ start:1525 stop:2454 length:930 start_codon:yes stop_codon:yes gene_type:complete